MTVRFMDKGWYIQCLCSLKHVVGLSSISSLTLGGTAEGLGFNWGFWCCSGDCVGWLVSWIEGLSWASVGGKGVIVEL